MQRLSKKFENIGNNKYSPFLFALYQFSLSLLSIFSSFLFFFINLNFLFCFINSSSPFLYQFLCLSSSIYQLPVLSILLPSFINFFCSEISNFKIIQFKKKIVLYHVVSSLKSSYFFLVLKITI